MERRELIVFSRRIGEYSTVQHHTALLSEDSGGGVVVEESVVPRPHDFPPSGLRVCFQVTPYWSDITIEAPLGKLRLFFKPDPGQMQYGVYEE